MAAFDRSGRPQSDEERQKLLDQPTPRKWRLYAHLVSEADIRLSGQKLPCKFARRTA